MSKIDTSSLPRALSKIGEGYRKYLPWLWMLTAFVVALAKFKTHRHNNFTIFRSSWGHLADGVSLYQPYPNEYHDLYLYGPTFAVLIAPLSFVPEPVAYLLWQMMLALVMLWAISKLPLSYYERVFVALISTTELITGLMMQQWNIGIGALILLSFAFTERREEHWAGLCIALGLTTKIYGIVGLAFFPFAHNKIKFLLSTALWTALLLALPYAFGSEAYITGQYHEWITTLTTKNQINLFAGMQNISLLGIIRKWSGSPDYPDLIPIAIGLIIYGIPFLRFGQYKHLGFRLSIVAATLLFVVLFSTGSENSGYIICYPGIALWYIARKQRASYDLVLLAGAYVLFSLWPSDLIPRFVTKEYIQPYVLKALFPSLIWLRLSYELITHDYKYDEATRPCTASL